MPQKSEKTKIIEYLITNAMEDISWLDDATDEDAIDEIYDDLNDDLMIVLACRRGVDDPIPKSITMRENVLINLSDDKFQDMFRVTRNEFHLILSLIWVDEEFKKPTAKQQISVELQLAITLCRLGAVEENAAIKNIATFFGIGGGGSVGKVTTRIFRVLLNLMEKYIYFPSAAERSEIVETTYHELPNCIGYLDSVEISLAEPPAINKNSYLSQTNQYSIKTQILCDHNLQIRDVVIGSPGSCNEAEIFENSALYKEKHKYFNKQEWMAADSKFPLTDITITPFPADSKPLNVFKMNAFNERHSQYYSRVQHCLRMLKERFRSLQSLKVRIINKERHQFCCDWILVCCLLQNILLLNVNHIEVPLSTPVLIESEECGLNDASFEFTEFEMKRFDICETMLNK